MNAAQAHEYNMWLAFIIVGLPVLIVFGGHFLTSMALAVAALALFFSHPAIAIVIAIAWLFPWRFLFFGFALGEGLKFSGVFRRLGRRRQRYPRRSRWSRADRVRPSAINGNNAADRNPPLPSIKGYSREQVQELRRQFPGQI